LYFVGVFNVEFSSVLPSVYCSLQFIILEYSVSMDCSPLCSEFWWPTCKQWCHDKGAGRQLVSPA